MVFIPTLGFFFVSDILGGGKSDMIGNLIERQFQAANNWPLGSALSIGLILLTLLLVRIYTRIGGKLEDLG
jgi:spermidine/putrescine transport system permease protein